MVLTSVLFGLPVVHWVLSPLVAAILVIVAILYALVGWQIRRRAAQAVSRMAADMDQLNGYGSDNLDPMLVLAEGSDLPALRSAFARLHADSALLHQGQWLPDPAPVLSPERLLTPSERNLLSLRPALTVLLIGIVASLCSLIAQIRLPLPTGALAALFSLLPLAVGTAGALLLTWLSAHRKSDLKARTEDLCAAVCRHVPAFGTQSGLSALVNAFLVYDRHMQDSLNSFNNTTARIAEADLAAGVQRSIERVLMETVAPPIAQATNALSDLSVELTNRQEKGMQDLAVRFATALSDELAGHLEPVYQQLSQLTPLMVDVKNYVEVALRSLQTARTEVDALNRQTDGSIRELADARKGFAEDLGAINLEISRLTEATSSMANIYGGNEKSLSGTIADLNAQMGQYAQRLAGLVAESSRSLREAQEAAQKQSDTSGQYVSDMHDQIARLTEGLRKETGLLLDQMRQETGQLTLQSTAINQRFGELNTLLDKTSHQFAGETDRYVRDTLKTFDDGLADVVGRLASAANEIRDAVDALPQVLRRSADFK